MKLFSFLAILLAIVVGVHAEVDKDVFEQEGNGSAKSLGSVKFTEDSEVEFFDAEGSIVMSVSVPGDQEDIHQVVRSINNEADGDPVLMFDLFAGASGKAPPGLVKAWEKVKEDRKKNKGKEPGGPGKLRGLIQGIPIVYDPNLAMANNDWWVDNYCTEDWLDTKTCQCYKSMTGSHGASDYAPYRMFSYVYPYNAPTGGVRHRLVKCYITRQVGEGCYLLWSKYVYEGSVSFAQIWSISLDWENTWYSAGVDLASGDYYHWSFFEQKNPLLGG